MTSTGQPVQVHVTDPSLWDKAVAASSAFAQVTVPFIALFLGWRFTENIESESTRKDLVNISVQILSEPIPEAKLISVGNAQHAVTENEIERDRYLRDWAVDILEDASPVQIPPDMAQALREGSRIVEESAAELAGPETIRPPAPEQPAAPEASTSDDQPITTPASRVESDANGPEALPIENLFGMNRDEAVAKLVAQGFKVNDFPVCSGSVAAGQVRQILDGEESIVYVDIGGTTAAGRSVLSGSALAVKIGNGKRC